MNQFFAALIRLWATTLEDEIDYAAARIGPGGYHHLDGLNALLDDMNRTVQACEMDAPVTEQPEPALVS